MAADGRLQFVTLLITTPNIKFYQNMGKIILMLHLHIQGLEDGLYNQIMSSCKREHGLNSLQNYFEDAH